MTNKDVEAYIDRVIANSEGREEVAHLIFRYKCESCGESEKVFLCFGVEGPRGPEPNWIASPLMIDCVKCGGVAVHTGSTTLPSYIHTPEGYRYMRVPKERRHYDPNGGGAEFQGLILWK